MEVIQLELSGLHYIVFWGCYFVMLMGISNNELMRLDVWVFSKPHS